MISTSSVIVMFSGEDIRCSHASRGEVATNRLDDQKVSILALHLLQIALVYVNTLMIQNVLADETSMGRMEPVDFRALTPLIHSHVNPYGNFELDMGKRLTLDTQAA